MRLKKIAYNLPFLNPIYSFFYFIFLDKSAKEKKEKKRKGQKNKKKTTSLKVYWRFGIGFWACFTFFLNRNKENTFDRVILKNCF